ncbi:MAG: MCE family protein [Actinomycetota bacterium]
MTPFRERNPVVIGTVGLLVLAALLLAAFRADSLPLIGGGPMYRAAFSEAGGLRPEDEVRIAGVKVGKVTAVDLVGDHVRVTFRVDRGTQLGQDTGASIRIKTVLGRKYLALEPKGTGQLAAGSEIPRSRTVAPYDVVTAFNDLSTTVDRIDTAQLAQALDTLAATFKDSPAAVRGAVDGLARLSQTIASRDAALKQLLARSNNVTKVLADRNQEFTTMLADGDLLLQEVQRRRDAIRQLLIGTDQLAQQLTGLVRDNRAALQPALDRLRNVVAVLEQNQQNLERAASLLGPFVRVYANTLGNGRWYDTYVQNFVPVS